MGIRVVQRAMAPPSPLQYTPGGATARKSAAGSAQSLGAARGPQVSTPSQATAPKLQRQTTGPDTGRPTVNGSLGGSNNSTPCKQVQKDPNSDQGCSDNEVKYI